MSTITKPMKKLVSTILLSFLLGAIVHAQTYDPLIKEGSFWDYEYWQQIDPNDSPFCPDAILRYQIASDTLINGNTYKKIRVYPLQGEPNIHYPEFCIDPPYYYNGGIFMVHERYIREDVANKKVYIWAQPSDIHGNLLPFKEMLLYDFDVEVGDVIENVYAGHPVFAYSEEPSGLEITETVTEKGFDTYLNRNYIQTSKGRYYEGLGSHETDLFRNFETSLSHWTDLRCFGDAQNQNSCAPILSTTNYQLEQIKIFPNPTSDYISFTNLDNNRFKLYSLLGKEINVTFSEETQQLDISHVRAGIYLLEITGANGGKRIQKIIKQ
jgi:hypothetical protein